ncbi:UDP-N-acetylmuramyl-tripeptide synthetase [Candidatus Uhrbacteria bacterium]|nr:UDP-N-acetylmuramyl-tripeptide synthetase [Candidatus Uhrbacteria bacterium]
MKLILKKLIPKPMLSAYHFTVAWLAAVWYGHPSEKMVVVGITGTSGKSSVVHFLRQILESAGRKVGALSTVEFCVAGKCKLNDRKMTMLGRMQTQKFLRNMVRAGCEIVIVETTSEGYLQSRHRFINYDIVVLTNLYAEHLEAHGGFENYKAAKLGIFKHVAGCSRKTLEIYRGSTSGIRIPEVEPRYVGKVAIVNTASEYTDEFLEFPFNEKIKFTVADALPTTLLGEHTPMNVAAALTVARALGIGEDILKTAASGLQSVPGRIEFIPEAEARGFRVIVDYAFEPVAMAALYKVVEQIRPTRVIHVLGQTGGGRDTAKRPVLGRFVAQRADIVIVTNEDSYDENPMKIIEDVAKGAEECKMQNAKCKMSELFKILDRKEAIGKALSLAQPGDLVVITGKGSEQAMCVAQGKKIPWDDRKVVREFLAQL